MYFVILDIYTLSKYDKVGSVGDLMVVSCNYVECHDSVTQLQCFELAEANTISNGVNFQPLNGKCCLKHCDDLCDARNVKEFTDDKWNAYLEKCGKYIMRSVKL